jgi:hypothetical protein
MERYLYFCNPNDSGAPNASGEIALYSTSSLRSIFALSNIKTRIAFSAVDGTASTEDAVDLTHADGDHKNVFNALIAMVNAEKTNNPFVVVADKEHGIFNIPGVTACEISYNV